MERREALLESLRDPHLPDVGWWPLAPGWWIVIALGAFAVAALAAFVVSVFRRRARARHANAWRRAARGELDALRERLLAGEPTGTLLGEASVLARRILLAVEPRAEIAPLHGEAWLRALDAAGGGERFTRGPARLLASAPFERTPQVTRDDLGDVLGALESVVVLAGRSRTVDDDAHGAVRPAASEVA